MWQNFYDDVFMKMQVYKMPPLSYQDTQRIIIENAAAYRKSFFVDVKYRTESDYPQVDKKKDETSK